MTPIIIQFLPVTVVADDSFLLGDYANEKNVRDLLRVFFVRARLFRLFGNNFERVV